MTASRDVLARLLRLVLSTLVLLVGACSYVPHQGEPLAQWSPAHNEQVRQAMARDRSPEIAILLAFSGGGTRAAALSYGVLQELDRTRIRTSRGERTMLQEVDAISSVSGGSFTAAYYGLYGRRIFADYEERFLRKDVQGELVRRSFSPANWGRLASPSFGRGDLAAEYYDEILFDDAPLGAMLRPNAPRVVINSTDLTTGVRIPFIQEMFDLFCVDLSGYPLSRAVAASSSVPLLFSPIAIQNHASSCGFQQPGWVDVALASEQLTSQKIAARNLKGYLDRDRRPWLHLVDGGISDNLGLRSYYRNLALTAGPAAGSRLLPHLGARHVLVVLVNANSHPHRDWAQEPGSPPFLEVLGSVSGSQIARFSEDTILITRKVFEQWVERNSTPARPVTFHFVEVSFDRLRDKKQREYLNNINTSFRLTDSEVDQLIVAGRELLAQSDAYRDFVELVQGLE